MEMHGIPVDVHLFLVKGNLNEGADDPHSGEWNTDEYKNPKIEFSDDFYDYLDNYCLMGNDDEEENQE